MIPAPLIVAGRLLAAAGVVQAIVYFFLGFDLFEAGWRVPLLFWIALPLPLAYGIGTRLARNAAGFAVLLAGMTAAFAFSAWVYWEITWGETRRTESMSGLMFLFGPLYQYAVLAAALMIAWLIGRRAKPR